MNNRNQITLGRIAAFLLKTPSQITAFLRNQISLGRITAFLYVFLVIIVAFVFIPGRDRNKHFTSLRGLGANTRLSEKLLLKPRDVSIEENFLLDQELKDPKGKYIRHAVEAQKPITMENVADWPDVKTEDAFPVELNAEPDWVFLNQGSIVQVWISNKPTPERALVLAILPSGDKWIALLRRQDLAPEALTGSKDLHVLRLEVMAGKVAALSPSPSASSPQSPSPMPAQTP